VSTFVVQQTRVASVDHGEDLKQVSEAMRLEGGVALKTFESSHGLQADSPARWAPRFVASAALVGLVVVVIVASRGPTARPTATEEPSPPSEAARPRIEVVGVQVPNQQVQDLQKRIADLEARAGSQEQPAVPPSDPAVEAAVERERHRVALDEHAREPANPSWAQQMATVVDRGLKERAAKGGFDVTDVDCRSRTCVASVEWKSAADAYHQWKQILGADYGSCGVEVVLDEDRGSSGRFGTKVLFPCVNQE
jgi:hypothetical protein